MVRRPQVDERPRHPARASLPTWALTEAGFVRAVRSRSLSGQALSAPPSGGFDRKAITPMIREMNPTAYNRAAIERIPAQEMPENRVVICARCGHAHDTQVLLYVPLSQTCNQWITDHRSPRGYDRPIRCPCPWPYRKVN